MTHCNNSVTPYVGNVNNDLQFSTFEAACEEDNLTCSICLQPYENPTVIAVDKCFHNYCNKCITKHIDNKQNCPFCLRPATRSNLHFNRDINERIEKIKNKFPPKQLLESDSNSNQLLNILTNTNEPVKNGSVVIVNTNEACNVTRNGIQTTVVHSELAESHVIPLVEASKCGDLQTVKRLLSEGVNVDEENRFNNRALFVAIANRRSEIVEILLENKASPDKPNKGGDTPLNLACAAGYIEMVELLLGFGALINLKNVTNSTSPLGWSALEGYINIVNLLLLNGAEVNTKNIEDSTPLHLATLNGHYETVQSLIAQDAEVNLVNGYGETPLTLAIAHGNLKIVQLLVAKGASIDYVNPESGFTPAEEAMKAGQNEIAFFLLNEKHKRLAELKNKDFSKSSIEDKTIPQSNNNSNPAINMVKGGAKVDEENELNQALFQAIENGELKLAETLLKNNAPPDQPNKDGDTPLIVACAHGNFEMVELLLGFGALINLKNVINSTSPLGWAAIKNHTNIVKLLLAKHADVNTKNIDGDTPLHLVARLGYNEIVKALLEHDADVNLVNGDGETPLGLASAQEDLEIVELLVAKGASIDYVNPKSGFTAVEESVKAGQDKITIFLISEKFSRILKSENKDFSKNSIEDKTISQSFDKSNPAVTKVNNSIYNTNSSFELNWDKLYDIFGEKPTFAHTNYAMRGPYVVELLGNFGEFRTSKGNYLISLSSGVMDINDKTKKADGLFRGKVDQIAKNLMKYFFVGFPVGSSALINDDLYYLIENKNGYLKFEMEKSVKKQEVSNSIFGDRSLSLPQQKKLTEIFGFMPEVRSVDRIEKINHDTMTQEFTGPFFEIKGHNKTYQICLSRVAKRMYNPKNLRWDFLNANGDGCFLGPWDDNAIKMAQFFFSEDYANKMLFMNDHSFGPGEKCNYRLQKF